MPLNVLAKYAIVIWRLKYITTKNYNNNNISYVVRIRSQSLVLQSAKVCKTNKILYTVQR